MEFKELNYPNTSRADRVGFNLNQTMQAIKDGKVRKRGMRNEFFTTDKTE